jgi:formylmethanofuran dehydrogenase subunit E
MSKSAISEETVKDAVKYHGHSCPGLAFGIRAVERASAEYGGIPDASFTATAETDKCPSDAIQFLTGCTFGNGKLILKDYGKNAFSFFRSGEDKGIRITLKPDLFKGGDDRMMKLRKKMSSEKLSSEEDNLLKDLIAGQVKKVMEADLESLFNVREVKRDVFGKRKMERSVTCESCNEETQGSRTRKADGKTLCIPCFNSKD